MRTPPELGEPAAPPAWQFRCESCGRAYEPGTFAFRCEHCGGLLLVVYAHRLELTVDHREQSMWRYASVLPVRRPPATVTMAEGNTPLVWATLAGRRVLLKLDSLCPSGSFKDRGSVVLVQYAADSGATEIVLDSSGNAASSVAMYAARAGIPCRVFAPADASPAKLLQAEAHGALVERVPGPRSNAEAAAVQHLRAPGSIFLNHNWHPLFAEGVKTTFLEIIEAAPPSMQHAFVPSSGGSAVAGAIGAVDLTGRALTLHAIQPEVCAPLAAAWTGGAEPVAPRHSIAEGANIARPPRLDYLLSELKRLNGTVHAVSEADIREATRTLWSMGIYVEPTGALGAAGFISAVRDGLKVRDDEAVILVTGHGLKTTTANLTLMADV